MEINIPYMTSKLREALAITNDLSSRSNTNNSFRNKSAISGLKYLVSHLGPGRWVWALILVRKDGNILQDEMRIVKQKQSVCSPKLCFFHVLQRLYGSSRADYPYRSIVCLGSAENGALQNRSCHSKCIYKLRSI